MRGSRQRVNVRPGWLLLAGFAWLAVFAWLLVLAASEGAAGAMVEHAAIHDVGRSTGADAVPAGRVRRLLAQRVAGRERLTGIVLLVLGSGYDRAGGSGAVRVLQRRLADLGAAPGAIDGRYGPRTENAVERFQAAHGLVVDGICGPKTLAALAVPVAVLFPGAGEQQPGGSPSVRALQRDLAAAGDAPGPIDGRYGPLTAQAVERFQGKHRLGVDGIVGSYTWRALVVARRAAARRSPRELAVPRSRPARRVPGRRAVVRERPRAPGLPVGLVLLGLAALGLLTASYSYARASARVRRARANPRQERGEHGHGPARAAWQGNGVLVAGEKEGER